MSDQVFPAGGLVQLIYVSRSKIAPADRGEAVRQILIKSITNNRMVDVTGQLISHGGLFMQLLEGPAASVRATYERVAADPRHDQVRLLTVGPATARLFRDWNMTERHLPADAAALDTLDGGSALALMSEGRRAA